jgi:NAD(P)-dependent dehydrogenase (short-subunit alcohol dehydrogenase family)
MNLVLLDVDAPRLADVAASLPGRVETHVVDVADADGVATVAASVLAEHPRIRLLINNAGVALGGRFDQVTLDEFEWVIRVNFLGTVRLTHALLPALKAEPGSHLVNLSSLFGIIAPGGQAAYSASKFAVRGFTEALRQELEIDGIGVTAVHPGGIKTRIGESAKVGSGVPAEYAEAHRDDWKRLLTLDPAEAARVILRGVERRRGRVLITRTAKVLDVVARTLPVGYTKVLAAAARRRDLTASPAPVESASLPQPGSPA